MTSPKTLSTEQGHALLNYLFTQISVKRQKAKPVRNYLITVLMLDAGLRVGETVLLTISDLWLNDEPKHSLRISELISKNKQARIIPLSHPVQDAIRLATQFLWLEHDFEIDSFAFAGRAPTRPLSARQVENIIGRAGEKVFGYWINPHMLRHTFGTQLMRTSSARVAQDLLGHKHLSSTQIYQHPNEDDKRKAIDSLPKGGD